ncbi:PREDICTED: probable histone-lysine N-methyltransferase CG1716 [Drosophila arizonae]|uniref:[histone H3]-lysine(36) N-trimethyltransferase n=1 Tax=Drosophila arizonae TaxID=7263 RepID=A0ABM1PAH7_DROAR|nr:PREDICTED: probable histone-lysine N-methyltransferase CG1716 [Drosophila arizonae]
MDKSTGDEITKPPAPRKRLGRPPKANAQESELTEEMEPPAEERTSSSSPTNCRRSTRKKIVKFDVLDVLNKSRKTHKIQIEARIDSNAPTTTTASTTQLATSSATVAKPAIEVNRLFTPRPPLPVISPLLPLDMFTKPKPTPSLIVAQVSSDKTPTANQQQQPQQSQQQQQQQVIRKRGRPRKSQITDNATAVDCPKVSIDSTKLLPSAKEQALTLKRESPDSDESLKSFSIIVDDETNVEAVPEENDALDDTIEVIETDIISVASDEDSDSQIIFVDIETAKMEAEEDAENDEVHITAEETRNFKLIFPKENENMESETPQQISIVEEIPGEDNIDDKESELLAEVLSEPAELWFTEDERDEGDQESQDEKPEKKSNIEVAKELPNEGLIKSKTPVQSIEKETKPTSEVAVKSSNLESKVKIEVQPVKKELELSAAMEDLQKKVIMKNEASSMINNEDKAKVKKELSKEVNMKKELYLPSSSATIDNEDKITIKKELQKETKMTKEVSSVIQENNDEPHEAVKQSEQLKQSATPTSAKEPVEKMKDAHFELESLRRAAKATGIELKLPMTMEKLLNANSVTEPVKEVEAKKEAIKKQPSLDTNETSAATLEKTDLAAKQLQQHSDAVKCEETDPKLKSTKSAPEEHNSESVDTKPIASEKGKANEGAKLEKSSASYAAFVECDALFKVLDKANEQMRHEEKAKKKSKLATKKQSTEQLQERATPQSRGKKLTSQENSRRNTISEERHEDVKLPLSNKRRNSVHPFKPTLSPERATESEPKQSSSSSNKKKSAQKKPTRKATKPKQLPSSQDSLDSSSSSSTRAGDLPSRSLPTPTSELEASNPLHDIAKFIEDGVKLLERDYKVEDEQQQQPDQQPQEEATEDELAQRVANLETPVNTPAPSPVGSTDDLSAGVRRSHRIKQKPQGAKSSLGRGSSSQTPTISMEQQLSELAHIEAINEQFLRQEGLNTFQILRDNYYRCARQVSKENAEMQCDCFVTGDEEGQGMRCGDGCINRMLMIECGPLCSYGDRCTNKRFQQHQGWPCRVFRTEKKGCGITAELQIQPGEFIMEYVGEVIDSEEFERRQHLYSEDRNRHYYFMALRGEAIIDATTKGNISRYINHSCDPNAETQKWTVNGELRIGFFSVKTIMPGEEITFDYQYQRYGRDAQRCYCESANCRGWIGNEPESDEGEQLDSETESEPESLVEELRPEQEAKTKTPKSKSKKQLKLPTARKQRKEQPKAKDREYKAGRWLRPSGGIGGEKSAARKLDQLEDTDVLEQLTLLGRSGLKNQLDTLRLSRCMVRAKLLQSRLQLLGVLTRGELPCRRLFLDYHGLRLLHAWISESGSDKQLRLALLESLESLPIPNRTMLNDSRIYQSVELWGSQLAQPAEAAAESQSDDEESMRQRIAALLQKWNGLPEIFRIPKRERIEQMKEHEREADRQQHVATALGDSNNASSVLSTDRYRQDRFRRDTSSRYEKSKPPTRMSGNNTICTITTQPKEWQGSAEGSSGSKSESRRRSEFDPRRTISKELRRSLFERKVAQDEAEKRVGSEDWREHELRCEYFGADLNTDPKLLPFYQNTETNEWFNSEDAPVPAPLRCGDIAAPPSPEQEEDVEYKLPAGVEPLPPSWHWSMTPEGDIYYYNLRDRIPQWEPPNAEQRLQQLVEDSPEKELVPDEAASSSDLVNIDIDYVGSLSAKSLAQYIEVKIRERREMRRNRLVSVRVISPRREEDRLYNQQESRKYKENKEKIRRRKEIYRRTRNETNTVQPAPGEPSDSLPIHGYLYSSDEDGATEGACSLPLLDAAVDGDKELPESLSRRRSLRASSPSSTSSTDAAESLPSAKRKLLMTESQKKHRDSKRKSLTTGREASDKFHFEISGHVAEFLRPYRQENCQLGRITSDEDYKFLIKRLSHHITTKEMRYCDMTGNPLACTESVKHKSYDFIKQYMRKKGPVYKKPVDKPD